MRNLKLEGKIVIFNSDEAGLFEGIFFWEGGELFSPPSPPPHPLIPPRPDHISRKTNPILM